MWQGSVDDLQQALRRSGLALLVGLLVVGAAPAEARDRFDVRLFARVPSPGAPEGVSIAPDGTIYTASLNADGNGDPKARSKVFAFSPAGKLLRSYEIKGQDLTTERHGLTGLAFDSDGRLYIGDLAPPRVLRLDPKTGRQQVYATLRDIPPCAEAPARAECSPGNRDFPSWPDYLSFAPDGTLYQTDSLQGLLWRIPKGGGKAEVWFRDDRLATEIGPPAFGPSGLELMPDDRTLMFTTVAQPVGSTPNALSGRIWKLPIRPDGRPGELQSFWESGPVEGPGGIGFGVSGLAYVALSGSNQIAVLSPQGKELERGPGPVQNALFPVPVDNPLGVAFQGERLLVANSSFLLHSPSAWALLDVFAGERGAPDVRPPIDPCAPASGRIGARRLGPARLGWTRARTRTAFRRRVTRGSFDRFCLQGGGNVRVGYPSRRLRRSLVPSLRRRVRGRAVLLLSSSRHYAARGLRVGASALRVRARLRRSALRLRVGPSAWYLSRGRRSMLVFRVRRGRLRELGIATLPLSRSGPAARVLLKSFRPAR